MDAVTIPEPISPVKDFLANSQKLLIDGKRIDAVSGETFEVLYPFTNTVLTRVSKGGEVTIRNMVSPQVFGQNISTRLIKWRKDLKPEQYGYCHNNFEVGAPFGGYKRSGFGREMGIHALENYTQVKNVIIQLNHSA